MNKREKEQSYYETVVVPMSAMTFEYAICVDPEEYLSGLCQDNAGAV